MRIYEPINEVLITMIGKKQEILWIAREMELIISKPFKGGNKNSVG